MDKKKFSTPCGEIRNTKTFAEYEKKKDLLLDFQLVRAYYGDSGCNIHCLVEKILKEKYNYPWQEKIIKKALQNIRGQRNALVSIPQFKYEERVNDILAKFVKRKFDKMVSEVLRQPLGTLYPLNFRDMVQKNTKI